MSESKIIPDLFKTEYSKMVSVLARSFGLDRIETAEDIVSETFLSALNIWAYKGEPENPTAWLYAAALNRLKNHLIRNKTLGRILKEQRSASEVFDESGVDFSDKGISDSQLQMLFALCHPSISTEAQISLALRILGGLGLNEIADAFFSNKETIHKRLQRAKETLYAAQIKIEMPPAKEIHARLNTVLQTIYLLFSEGYYSESNKSIVRKELCAEALNLAYLLLNNPITNNHDSNSLMALMCFNSSRLNARQTESGELILYDDQDRTLWDAEFIEKGFHYLQQASQWEITSPYYIEASIAYWHTVGNENPDKWPAILKLYDVLLLRTSAKVVALNRIWAVSKVHGNLEAIAEAGKLEFTSSHFYFILLAELYRPVDSRKAIEYLERASRMCKSEMERELTERRLRELKLMIF